MRRGAKTETHDFYCINCSNKGIPLSRQISHSHEKFHRKKLFCIYCRTEVNHIECRNEQEINEFLANYKEGMYKNEAEESLHHVRNTWLRQNKLD